MKKLCLLSDLTPGQTATVKALNSHGALRRRMLDMGLIEGTKISCELKSPFGDPAAFKIRGAVISLRNEDSGKVIVLCE